MTEYKLALLGGALLWVLVALAEYSRPVARLLCRVSLHHWRTSARSTARICSCCHRHETATVRNPRPWDWH